MLFDSPENRAECVNLMKEVAKGHQPTIDLSLRGMLNAAERDVHHYVQNLGFQEGAWYRPSHNVIVPASMIAICREEGFNRDLVYAALLHDAGNSLMKIAPTTDGADWENADKRWKHMEIGGIMLYSTLGLLQSRGVDISNERIGKLKEIVDTHDFPYLGEELIDREAKAHRGADRCFVPSALSWYKDMVAHYGDSGYQAKSAELGFTLSPKEFLRCRLAFFYEREEDLPTDWNTDRLPLDTSLEKYNEGNMCETFYTRTDKAIIDGMFMCRAEELGVVEDVATPQRFARMFEDFYKDELASILCFARGNNK